MDPVRWRQYEARMRLLFNEMKMEVLNRDWNEPLKPWSEFFQRFTVPKKDIHVIANRAVLNSHIYQANYCLIFGGIFLLYVLTRPSSIFVIGGIIVGFVYTTSPTPLVINGKRITRRDRYRAFFTISLLALVITGILTSFLKVLSLSVLLVLLHACFRHTNIRHKISHFRNQPPDAW